MKKGKTKSIRLLFLLMFFLMLPNLAFAEDVDNSQNNDGYNTQSYDVTMNVNENKSIDVNEDINVDFTESKHGIFRYIPLGSTSKNGNLIRMDINDIDVEGYNFTTYNENESRVIQIGDENQLVDGKQEYKISYTQTIYDDMDKEGDSLYINVLPFDWSSSIEKSKIVINMPKEFDKNNFKYIVGTSGAQESSSYNNNVNVNLSGKKIVIESSNYMPKGVGITVKIDLPEGYFTDVKDNGFGMILMYVFAFIGILLSIILWILFGRDPKIVQTVELYPPEDLSPMALGYIIDGIIDTEDVGSMIFYFANKGYLNINEKEKEKYELVKNIDNIPDNEPTYIKTLFDGLFSEEDTVEIENLPTDFFDGLEASETQLKKTFSKKDKKLFSKKATISQIVTGLLTASIIFVAGFFSLKYSLGNSSLFIASCIATGLYVIGIWISDYTDMKRYTLSKGKMIIRNVIAVVFMALSCIVLFFTYEYIGYTYAGIAFIAMIVVTFFFSRIMRARTKYGAEIQGKILGYKDFIKKAELKKLEMLIYEDPKYFYDTLPYAQVFGLSKKWTKNFKNIEVGQPSWYSSTMDFNGTNILFSAMLYSSISNNIVSNMSQQITSSKIGAATEAAGRFGGGGGGFSGGGGFGGGGGGSW